MRRGSVHQVLLPTIWGYATLTRRDHPALPEGGGTRRVDSVLPPVLTPDELDAFHDGLRRHPGAHRRTWSAAASSVRVRRALELAIDLRTTAALHPADAAPAGASDVGLAALVRAMRTVSERDLCAGRQALARELVWCALTAAREDRACQVLHAARALAALAVTDARSDRIDHG